jgi:hypothetical protein
MTCPICGRKHRGVWYCSEACEARGVTPELQFVAKRIPFAKWEGRKNPPEPRPPKFTTETEA